MSNKISQIELDELIKNKIREKGLSNDIGEDKITEIKNAISLQLKKPEISEVAPTTEQPITPPVPITNTVPQQSINSPESITKTTTISKDAIDLAKREGELEEKEKEFSQKQSELTIKEKELLEKEQALSYKPQVPEVLQGLGNEELFIFNENEISLGAEALSKTPFRLMSNPDEKRSMIDLWTKEGKKSAYIYKIKFEKIGEIIFDPFQGTSNYIKKPFEDGQNINITPNDGLTPAQAQASQEPTEPMIDIIEPKLDVISTKTAADINTLDIDNLIKDRIDMMIKNHFIDKYPKM